MNPLFKFIIDNPDVLLHRDFLISTVGIVEFRSAVKINDDLMLSDAPECYIGKLFTYDDKLCCVTKYTQKAHRDYHIEEHVVISDIPNKIALCDWWDPIELKAGDLPNITSNIKSTLGRFVLNYIVIASIVGDKIPYINDIMSAKDISKKYVDLRLSNKITNKEIHDYVDNAYFIGNITELSVPTFSEKSITSSPNAQALKEKLLKQYKDSLGDPKTMVKIEDALIEEDRKYLDGDVAMGFLSQDSKSFDTHRKTMFGIGGITEEFGTPGQYTFSTNSLEEGWSRKDFPNIVNEIRRGIYNRGTETMKGGEGTNFMMRIFQNTRVTEDDCNTTQTFDVYLAKDIANNFRYRNIMTEKNELIALTPENLMSYVNTTVRLRTPMMCQAKKGYCFACMGALFTELNQKSLATGQAAITGIFMMMPMKAMHGGKVSTREITSLDAFVA